jgi:hypothetical protein
MSRDERGNRTQEVIGAFTVGSVQSFDAFPFSVGSARPDQSTNDFLAGELDTTDPGHVSTFANLLTTRHGVLSARQPLVITTLSTLGGSISAQADPGFDGISVTNPVQWDNGSLTVFGGGIVRFAGGGTVFGTMNLCFDTLALVPPGTTLTLNGAVLPCTVFDAAQLRVFGTVVGNGPNFRAFRRTSPSLADSSTPRARGPSTFPVRRTR